MVCLYHIQRLDAVMTVIADIQHLEDMKKEIEGFSFQIRSERDRQVLLQALKDRVFGRMDVVTNFTTSFDSRLVSLHTLLATVSMASSKTVSTLAVLLLASTASAQLDWGRAQGSFLTGRHSCENQGHLKIENAATYCCKINPVAYHCLAVLGLENQKSAIVEQSGSAYTFKNGNYSGENRAEIECHFVNSRATMDDLTEKSWLFKTAKNDSYTPELQQPTKTAAEYIGGYNSAGVVAKGWKENPNYKMTLAGLKES
eukprot:s3080_g7.t1